MPENLDQNKVDELNTLASEATQPMASKPPLEGGMAGAAPMENVVKLETPEPRLESTAFIDRLLNIPITIRVELGRSRLLVDELVKMHKGSVIELDKSAGENLSLVINDKVIGQGEVIVMNSAFGIRVTDSVAPTERIKNLE